MTSSSSLPARRRPVVARIRRLSDLAVEAADVEGVVDLLARALPEVLGVEGATLLLWNRRLDTFEALSPGETRRRRVRPEEPGVEAPETRWMLSDGQLLATPGGGEGVLVPLMARSGLVGVLILGPRRRRREPPLLPAEARALQLLAARAALGLENRLYQVELLESERMAALGTMAGMLAHDLRSPMTVIRGYAETLVEGEPTREEVRSRATLIVQMVDRLERMTRETLDFARGGGLLACRTLGSRELLDELVEGLHQDLPGLEVVRDGEADPVPVRVDVDKLRRVVGNMAGNALDAMKGRGRFHLGTEVLRDEAGAGWLVLHLADEGPGVPDEVRARLFDPFVTHGKRGGTGLGLAVARRFVEDHGGRIELAPAVAGEGARFVVHLPLQAGP